MNQNIKDNLLKIYYFVKQWEFGNKLLDYMFIFKTENRKLKNSKSALISTLKNLPNFYIPSLKNNRGMQIAKLFEKVDINIPDEGFIYTIDEYKTINNRNRIIDNISIDNYKVINWSLKDMTGFYSTGNIINQAYLTCQFDYLYGVKILLDREISALNESNRVDKDKYINFLENIKNNKAKSFEEALQRILFFNQQLWQTGHKLIGLGRLDKILNDLYYQDVEKGVIDKNQALNLIKSFLLSLHDYYWFKSQALMGDTGQIIILGGVEENGEYFSNDLTYLFIEAVKELNIPDPKCLLRVSDKTPRDLMDLALSSMKTGVGSPLLSNDEKVIPALIDYGYERQDAYNYVVSACWEPEPIGKSLGQNNIVCINYLIPLNKLFDNEDLKSIKNFNQILNIYLKKYLPEYVDGIIEWLNNLVFERDPILSTFIDDCNENQLDISEGGARYNNYGLTSVALGNTVNSLYNLKKFVFESGEYDLIELNNIRKNNFEGNDKLVSILRNQKIRYGVDNEEIISLSNIITDCVNEILLNNYNKFGGRFKFGLSSPDYIMDAPKVKASFDGKRDFEPLTIHIANENSEDYIDLIRFASKLDYSGARFNGNVTDFMVNPSFIENHYDKFLDFLILSRKQGYYQMQMNVISSETLIRAKEHPNEFPNLIVRVWGFSAYFNDLPDSYKDFLIDRTLKNEGKVAV